MNRTGLFVILTLVLSATPASAQIGDELGKLILNDGVPTRPLAGEAMNPGELFTTDQIGELERSIETSVREVVAGILPHGRFAAFVHVTLTGDTAKLRAFQQEMEFANLPGLPSPDSGGPTTNRLQKLIKNKKITLILDEEVGEDQEAIVQDVLRSKLTIREASGDILMVRRSKLPAPIAQAQTAAAQDDSTRSPTTTLNIAMAFFGITLLLALGAIVWLLVQSTRRSPFPIGPALATRPAAAIPTEPEMASAAIAQPKGIEAVAIPDRLVASQPGDPDSVIQLFGGMHAEVEDRLLGLIATEDTETSEMLENHFFGFNRIGEVPLALLSAALKEAAPEWIAAAIAGIDDANSDRILEALDTRTRVRVTKRLTLEDSSIETAPKIRSEAAKRVLLALVRKQLDRVGLKFKDVVEGVPVPTPTPNPTEDAIHAEA